MFRVVLSKKADCDIENIRRYIAYVLLRPDSAETIVAEIQAKLKSLATFPEGTAIYEYEPWKSRLVRCAHVRHYRIFFYVDRRTKTVQIIRIVYSSRNPESVKI